MGNTQSYVYASLSACSLYFIYVYLYSSHRLKTNVLSSGKLPSLAYLYIKYLIRGLTRRSGHLYTSTAKQCEVDYTVVNCR